MRSKVIQRFTSTITFPSFNLTHHIPEPISSIILSNMDFPISSANPSSDHPPSPSPLPPRIASSRPSYPMITSTCDKHCQPKSFPNYMIYHVTSHSDTNPSTFLHAQKWPTR